MPRIYKKNRTFALPRPFADPDPNSYKPTARPAVSQRQLLVGVGDARVLGHHLPAAAHNPLAGQKTLHPNRPARVDAAGGDAHLRTQAKPEAVREARGGVVEHARTVNTPQERVSCCCVFRHDGFCRQHDSRRPSARRRPLPSTMASTSAHLPPHLCARCRLHGCGRWLPAYLARPRVSRPDCCTRGEQRARAAGCTPPAPAASHRRHAPTRTHAETTQPLSTHLQVHIAQFRSCSACDLTSLLQQAGHMCTVLHTCTPLPQPCPHLHTSLLQCCLDLVQRARCEM